MFLWVKKDDVALPEIIENTGFVFVGWKQEGGMEERREGSARVTMFASDLFFAFRPDPQHGTSSGNQ